MLLQSDQHSHFATSGGFHLKSFGYTSAISGVQRPCKFAFVISEVPAVLLDMETDSSAAGGVTQAQKARSEDCVLSRALLPLSFCRCQRCSWTWRPTAALLPA